MVIKSFHHKVSFCKKSDKFTLRGKNMKPELINRPQYLNKLIDFIATKDWLLN
ncbi:hypothetical protein HMPREF5175_01561 [Lactobacillus gasseri SV-16A-US]|uniref:Uncharacterized protein n=3 Tax=Lactobacillus gasseri TaxID=1596 RepID=A0A805Z168_LACGA|nr:hypothetical protein LGAS_1879 [Lactobacillus gasseri ATCC 33323 = JCM 1131]EEQ26821.1 hypothetical protein HMPREF0890_0504 [Lactobacillus gasseri 202-4]EFB63752.1 hypothetical protein HMPREF9209_1579 [Lactobacillus gasseri 224-1]EFQ47081.1 hypothetical protein LBGG_01684 [Lactobacillus gasseri MV-22]KFL95293.1 hypothetical protein HMPREF0516_01382 [Lactobacillus gasseri SJ-9E-US]KFL97083.1 hypothetical protein HMPREF5175_01561 [Lactobacillus gasseri SV-16A-US]KXA23762.1 hypothetical prote